jgi:hypothetical protein
MAAKKAKQAVTPKPPKPHKSTMAEKLTDLQMRVQEYFNAVRWRKPDSFQIEMHSQTQDGKPGTFNVASLIASVLTAQGLGKEVRLEAIADAKGGTLYVRMYSPVPKNGLDGYPLLGV